MTRRPDRITSAFRFAVLALALALFCLPQGRALADDPSIVTAIAKADDASAFGLDIDVAGPAKPALVLLRHPYRVALDFDATLAAAKLPELKGDKLVKDMRHGLIGADRYRLILTLTGAARPELTVTPQATGSRVGLRLMPGDDAAFAAAAATTTRKIEASAKVSARPQFVVVLDPGHGGIDNGATGEKGTEEKTVNLAFGIALRDALAEYPEVKVLMTREDDTFIPLNERAAIARRAGANLMLSLHADSIRYRDLRGATVYTLSEKASDSLSREIADSENSSDRFAGPEWDQDAPEIHDILVDLVRRETEGLSEHFALRLVTDLRNGQIRLINNPKRSAGFRVLRAPDVPSILLEMGYLSNPDDEKDLTSERWQKRLAGILAHSIADFAKSR
ncbi:N-acetylmuramoyl-L-alanine amidase [Aureimonas sp. SK2]|uniref:N-acetylmuramoyl-L-alanine amidase n=1 Tax=Aureimonas sp. SK2 TaxID=3015992 RepID=UPI0024438547|nr:N-acetylmuramoyl-L-alanine amidase [Aureimonas sp. SK2]